MTPEVLAALLTYGPLGIISGVLLKLYLEEKKRSTAKIEELNDRIHGTLEAHQKELKTLYDKMQEQEREFNEVLKNYGSSVVEAVSNLDKIADRIWRIRK